jgi:hypothetical protein
MEEDVTGQATAPALAVASPRPSRGAKPMVIVALLAFVIGVLLAGWLALRGDLDFALPGTARNAAPRLSAIPSMAAVPPGDAASAEQASYTVGGIETRLALLEERFARLDMQASEASGNAARAEGLLVAIAARRVIGKGGQLGFLEDQIKLRFGGAQPEAVRTVIAFGRNPVTIDQLYSGLDALAPALAEAPKSDGSWSRLKREFASLFVVRRANSPSLDPRDRLHRARLMLTSGKTAEAIEEVSRLPGAESAAGWIENARRYDQAQQALDIIETAAMLEPRKLLDAAGNPIDQPSPLAQPADMASQAQASQAPPPAAPATQPAP